MRKFKEDLRIFSHCDSNEGSPEYATTDVTDWTYRINFLFLFRTENEKI